MKKKTEPARRKAPEGSGSRFFFAVFSAALLALHLIFNLVGSGEFPRTGEGLWRQVSDFCLGASVVFIFLALIAPIFRRRRPAPAAPEAPDAVPPAPEPSPAPPPLSGDPVLSFLMHDLSLCSFRLDRDGKIVSAGAAFARLLGREPESLRGLDPAGLAVAGDQDAFRAYLAGHLAGEIPPPADFAFPAEGGRRVVRFGEARLVLPGESREILCAGVDVTDLRELEKTVLDMKGRIRKAARMEDLGILAGGVAHDIKNIINPMIGYPEIILRELPPESPLRDKVIKVRDAARRTRDTILNFLALARRGRFESGPVELNALIEGFMKSAELDGLRERFPRAEIEFQPGVGLPVLEGAASQIANMVMNLVRNAFEAGNERGKVSLRTSLVNLEFPHRGFQQVPRGSYLLLTVSDQGKGMDEETIKHMLDPFFSRKQMGRSGSGLGMAVVAGVIEDHGGYLDINSKPGEGTAFSIYFPCAPGSAPSREGDDSRPAALVIDPDYDARFQAKGLIESLGFRTSTAGVHEEGIRKASELSPVLILLDVAGLDDESGRRLLSAAARALGPGPDGVLLVTGSLPTASAEIGGRVLAKPLEIEELRRAVGKLSPISARDE